MHTQPPDELDPEDELFGEEEDRPRADEVTTLGTLLALMERHPCDDGDSPPESEEVDPRHSPHSVHADKNAITVHVQGLGDRRVRWREIHRDRKVLWDAKPYFDALRLEVEVHDSGKVEDAVTITVTCCLFPLRYWESRGANDGFRAWRIVVTKSTRTDWLLTDCHRVDHYFD